MPCEALAHSQQVLDQTLVPEDERLKMMILVPKGLKNENDTVKHGVGVDGKALSSGWRSRIGRGSCCLLVGVHAMHASMCPSSLSIHCLMWTG